ncbi:MAG: hypothetical protein KDD61_07850 [Bdellovibrionales bacterium]|nr:hypothetical protein [Bdellovibrionales bacterium]
MLLRTFFFIIAVAALSVGPFAHGRVVDASQPVDQAFNYTGYQPPVVSSQSTLPKESSTWDKIKSTVATQIDNWLDEKPNDLKKENVLVPVVQQRSLKPASEIPPTSQAAQVEEKLSDSVLELDGQDVKDSSKSVSEFGNEISGAPVFQRSNGRKGKSQLPKSKSGTPQYDFSKMSVSELPLLDIGEEDKISREDLTGKDLSIIVSKYGVSRKLISPSLVSSKSLKPWLKRKIVAAGKERKLKKAKYGLGAVVSHRKIDNVSVVMNPPSEDDLKKVIDFKKSDINMLGALILYEKKDRCHVVIGLFADLLKHPKYKNEAEYYLGACAHKMGFYSEAVKRLTAVVQREDKDYLKSAVQLLLKEIPKEYNDKVATAILSVKNKSAIDRLDLEQAHYYMAQQQFKNKKFKRAFEHANYVTPNSPYYFDSQYLVGVSEYSLGNVKGSEKRLEQLQSKMTESGVKGKEINSLVAISLGRVKFNRADYSQALSQYMLIKKDHPLWIEGLIEQGWTQLQLGDYAGAIGNMYSLHSPYFRAVYMPESHVIRTIGYLNICQFGDAYRSLSHLEKEHSQWYKGIDSYIKNTKLARQYYETVKKYLRGNSQTDVDGLPYQVIREISRRKEILNYQASMNEKEDELKQYGYIDDMVRRDKVKIRQRMKDAEQRAVDLKKKIALAEKSKKDIARLNEWRGFFNNERNIARSLRFELALYERGRQGYNQLHKETIKRFDKEKYVLGEKIGRGLVRNLYQVRDSIKEILNNNEYLRYEIFAGSGENIRYQVAGGESAGPNRLPASVKPSKSLNWDFAGEYWADEIGAYRSSLVNNCPSIMGNENQKLQYKDKSHSLNEAGGEGERS